MEVMAGFGIIFSPDLLGLMVVGLIVGIVAGAIPGITGAVIVSLALPFTFPLSALQTLILLSSIMTGVGFGGAITAVLLGIPGAPGALPLVWDGHLMAQHGKAGQALGAALGASVAGNLFGSILLLLFLFPLAAFALRFGPPEMMMVVLLALLLIGSLRGTSAAKGILAGFFGIVIGTIGISPTGATRGVFDIPYLLDGLPFIAVLVGIFTVPGLIEIGSQGEIAKKSEPASARDILRGMAAPLRYPLVWLQSSLVGVVIGVVPAAGGAVASLLGYNMGKAISPRGKQFGKGEGEEEAIVAAQSANTSDEAGSSAVMYVLGIPGSSSTAVLLGALIVKGWVPGPRMVFDHFDVIAAVRWGELLQAIVLTPFAFVFCYYARYVVHVRSSRLVPILACVMVVGVFSMRGNIIDVWVALGFGVIAFFMARAHYPAVNMLIGIILGPMLERELVRTYLLYEGRWELLLNRPITMVLAAALLLTILLPLALRMRRSSARRATRAS